ncbi:hypothetical protein DFH08DRAFT_800600 [Mycena albidolilacea]|uniref:Uncharacterized protein n=1 Tax=Mycena albidolilacea TaxID=1033008 RepID=A0AAD7F2E2_9AGAR|nr:hypothetical protein DFH08DRAFT_800600 [Mycena albidolilacea]
MYLLIYVPNTVRSRRALARLDSACGRRRWEWWCGARQSEPEHAEEEAGGGAGGGESGEDTTTTTTDGAETKKQAKEKIQQQKRNQDPMPSTGPGPNLTHQETARSVGRHGRHSSTAKSACAIRWRKADPGGEPVLAAHLAPGSTRRGVVKSWFLQSSFVSSVLPPSSGGRGLVLAVVVVYLSAWSFPNPSPILLVVPLLFQSSSEPRVASRERAVVNTFSMSPRPCESESESESAFIKNRVSYRKIIARVSPNPIQSQSNPPSHRIDYRRTDGRNDREGCKDRRRIEGRTNERTSRGPSVVCGQKRDKPKKSRSGGSGGIIYTDRPGISGKMNSARRGKGEKGWAAANEAGSSVRRTAIARGSTNYSGGREDEGRAGHRTAMEGGKLRKRI